GDCLSLRWLPPRRSPDLPLPGWPHRVDEGRIRAVDSGGLSVGVGDVLVGVQDLHLVPVHEVDSAVAAILVLASWRRGCCPFQMQFDVSESQARLNRPGAGNALEISIAQAPGRRLARRRLPGGEILSIEQNDGIG